jgi:hypothetical protein
MRASTVLYLFKKNAITESLIIIEQFDLGEMFQFIPAQCS